MQITFKKRNNKSHILQIMLNGDQTPTIWQRSDNFFVPHDLVHYAVETTLGYTDSFYGLLKAGHSIESFEGPREQRPTLSAEAINTEMMVGLFLQEQMPGQGKIDNLLEVLFDQLQVAGITTMPAVNDTQVELTRKEVERLLKLWEMTADGESLTLFF
jgi:hypothetical protein